jgi:chromosome segregation ATPase
MEVKGLLSDLHTASKTLRQDVASAREMIKELDAAKERFVEQSIEDEVLRQMNMLNEEIKREMAEAVTKVNAEFQKLSDLLMGRTDGKIPLDDLVKKALQHGL